MAPVLETVESPNFSVILPGPCTAHCSFCFWRRDKKELDNRKFMERLKEVISKLPPQFTKCSITGGEPTLSPVVRQALYPLRHRFDKLVFTTNGANFFGVLPRNPKSIGHTIADVCDFVNISRHSISDEENCRIFGARMPTSEKVREIIETCNRRGVPVCANCVLPSRQILASFNADAFIQWAKLIGFSSVCFRKPHEEGCDLKSTIFECQFMDYKKTNESFCPVCRSTHQLIHGIEVVWSASIPEPSEGMGDVIYEAVLHPDGTLSADWSKNLEIEL